MNPAPRRPDISRDAFVQALVRSRILDRARIDAALKHLPADAPARAFAEHLINAGEITHYQAEKLLQGLSHGLVLGPYTVLAPLGKGGMGTVYLARDARLGAAGPDSGIVALKVLPAKRAREEERTLQRFRREMDLSRHVEHENITRTFDAGEVAGVHYIAMEFVPGHTVRQVVARDGPMSVATAASVFSDVCAGLAHAHAGGLIHRDLKPSNIMVTPEGRGKILDFGLAILMGETLPADPSIVGGQGYILGTMDYIAPEQAVDSTNVGPWSDLYAVGCSLYFALTGAPPFPGGSSKQKIHWHKREDPPPVNMLNPTVPAEVARLVEKLMAKKAEDRPVDAEAVRAELARWTTDTGVVTVESANHTARELLAEVDTRSVDPSLWDATPFLALDGDPTPDPPAKSAMKTARPRSAPRDDDSDEIDRRNQVQFFWIAIGGTLGLAFFTLMFLLLRRL